MKNSFIPSIKKETLLFFIGLLSVLLLVFKIYLPICNSYFTADDFSIIASCKADGFSLKRLETFYGVHFHPLTNLLWTVEYSLWRTNAKNYYLLSITMHLCSVLLTILIFYFLFPNKIIGILSGLFFGICPAHWRTVIFIGTQAQVMATFWFLQSILYFILFMRTQKRILYMISILAHLFTLLSFSSGFEMPLGVIFLSFFISKNNVSPLRAKIKLAIPYFFNILSILLIKWILSSHIGVEPIGGIKAFIMKVPIALRFVIGGMFFRYVLSFLGVYGFRYLFHDMMMVYFYVCIILFLYLLMMDWESIKKYRRYLCYAPIWIFCIYFLPAIGRIPWGYSWFVSVSRYAYRGCPFAAACWTICLVSLRVFKRPYSLVRVLLLFLVIFFNTLVFFSNIGFMQRQIQLTVLSSNAFKRVSKVYIRNLKKLIGLSSSPFYIIDKVIIHDYVAWNVTSATVAKIYLNDADLKHVYFLDEKKIRKILPYTKLPVYYVNYDGNIYRFNKRSLKNR